MRKRLLLGIIALLSFITGTIFFLTLFYIDPISYPFIGLGSLAFSGILSVASFFTLIFYFIKKIYFRGNVYIHHVLTSFRQGFFIGVFGAGIVFLKSFGVDNFLSITMLAIFFLCIELFISNIERKV